ncbi:MAG: hypothetical protein ACK6CP_21640 [Pseudanabaena sp.]|jgi:hypothetical protein|nr:hypothetical protein [Pseudanabaena sp. M090S1SP2A07QC]MCA6506512.1 hypothetical protein [Pseudanabaena sp. M172S2SP2A07QC]MCA6519314.1 hypothetical protein [Pseudanabaena sp. M110S1SP2A07QC]MCA6520995.1 hypothetical protein [Pseudanabaena sp. M051S1SP2A07QC]MCA6527603.1 hypothetical protein [Pseudanabaena sp. M179S2SP2A07QC]MCA6531796.1 hypothetical protein [Pseudanabaena sp. M125S2SP2A07QC]MCA6536008.1 hypothetical protein [Pseudanabaena sp. M176S2SP2A07QC]MCA6540430.1 hypothetical prot
MQTIAEPAKSLPKQPIATKAIIWVLFLLWTFSQVVQDAIAYSPFYHYGQLVLWSEGMPNYGYFWLHVIWLLWTSCAFAFLAHWAYQRGRAIES